MSRFREDAAPKAVRKFCPQCRYMLVRLHDFDGTSSLNAPKSEIYGAEVVSPLSMRRNPFLLGEILLGAVSGSLKANDELKRREQIKRLRDDILPADPDARVCPHCLHLVLTGE